MISELTYVYMILSLKYQKNTIYHDLYSLANLLINYIIIRQYNFHRNLGIIFVSQVYLLFNIIHLCFSTEFILLHNSLILCFLRLIFRLCEG